MPPVYPKSNIALIDARIVAVTWALLALLAISWLVSRWFPVAPYVIFQANFALFSLFALAHVVMGFLHECPACGKHPTIQGFKAVHPSSAQQSAVAGWGGVVVNVLRRHRLVCIHCGAEYAIEV